MKYDVISEQEDTLKVKGTEQGAPCTFEATFHVTAEDNKAKISVDVSIRYLD